MVVYFVERLTVRTWQNFVLPRLERDGVLSATQPVHLKFVDATPAGEAIARQCASNHALEIRRFDFAADAMHDATGKLLWLRMYYEDMANALSFVKRQSEFRDFADGQGVSRNLRMYLAKQVLPGSLVIFQDGLWRALYVLHACIWEAAHFGTTSRSVVVFLESRPWMKAFCEYASQVTGATVCAVESVPVLRPLLARLLRRDIRLWRERIVRAISGGRKAPFEHSRKNPAPRIGLQYYGHFNLDQPERHSDFFFWQQSQMPGESLVALFEIPADPLDRARMDQLSQHGISAVALRHDATTLGPETVCAPTQLIRSLAACIKVTAGARRRNEVWWLRSEARAFTLQKHYWHDVFRSNNVKVFVSWFKYNAEHCAVAEALNMLDGVLAIYQRSYEGNGTVQAALSADVCFVFSKTAAGTESAAGSAIDYCVVTGYLGDHRFGPSREAAAPVRASLQAAGASYVAAYFDENSGDDGRWILGHERERRNYAFILAKVLDDPAFGLVLKPKSPRTLRKRLGDTAATLDRALKTGRCHIYEDGPLQGSTPPVQAALAADLTIHGSVAAATAGVEAALAGARVVLLDDDGWSISPLNRLGRQRVIFDDWNSLWSTWAAYRREPSNVNGFADWSPVLDDLDPFRDGRGAERMGVYLQWLVDGYNDGHSKSKVLAAAADRYKAIWGSDKVFRVDAEHRSIAA